MDVGIVIGIAFILIVVLIAFAQLWSKREPYRPSTESTIYKVDVPTADIIKETQSRLAGYPGKLSLTWDALYFQNGRNDVEIPLKGINSTEIKTRSDVGYLSIKFGQAIYDFEWRMNYKINPAVTLLAGPLAIAANEATKSVDPNLMSWFQLIDDLRFGRLKRPETVAQ